MASLYSSAPDGDVAVDGDTVNGEHVEHVLSNRVPFADWPEELQAARNAGQDKAASAELQFQLVLGLLVAMMSLSVDALAMPDMVNLALGLKLLTIVPLAAVGLLLLKPTHVAGLKLVAGLSLICFGGSLIHLASFATPEMAVRYSMACAMLLGVALLLLPFSPRESARFGLTFALVTIAAGFWPNPLDPMAQFNHILMTGLIGIPCWVLGQRYFEISNRSFLYGLRDQALREELEKSNAQLRELSRHDPLTGLANRRHFENEFHAKFQAVDWHRGRTALLLIDIDRFKQFNDSYGHLAGDQYLRQFAAVLNRIAQASGGLAARYGGEEFVVVVRERKSGEGQRIAATLREELAELVLDIDTDDTEPLTASVGIAHASTSEPEALERIVARADAALYQAKRQGRNRVICADILAA